MRDLDVNFTWVPIYRELSYKILEFKDDRTKLLKIMYEILEELNLFSDNDKENCNLDKFNGLRCKYDDFDPFSFMNRFDLYNDENRRKFISKFQEKTGLAVRIPNDFDGIPKVNPQVSCFLRLKDDREPNDVNDFWEFFDVALKFADNHTSVNRKKFIEFYDKIIVKPNCKFNVSMSLFKICPNFYLNLDKTNRDYLEEIYQIHVSGAKAPDGGSYLELIEKVQKLIAEDARYDSLLDFSDKAWKAKKSNLGMENKNTENEDRKYFWLNASPSMWSFSDISVGEIQEYTSINESGHKRRIYSNYESAKKGDIVIGYESTPVKAIVCICEVERELENDLIAFKKIEQLVNPIPFSTITTIPKIQNMEALKNAQGSLFKLTKEEYDVIYDVIRKKNTPSLKEKYNKYDHNKFLKEVFIEKSKYKEICDLLIKKKNIILQGAPGVGKTFMAKKIAYSLIGEENKDRIEFVQFHQSYSYEDFIEGFRPTKSGKFILENGIFYNVCKKAEKEPNNNFYLIIDEINRGNLSKIFGELLMLIENDKRGKEYVTLAYSKNEFTVPSNLYIIGMMNTADRSLAIMDYALRRRFSFVDIEPAFENDVFQTYLAELNNEYLYEVIAKIKKLNEEIIKDPSLGEGFVIGHSYFCNLTNPTKEEIKNILKYDILPLLKEYWFDEENKVRTWKKKLLED